MSNDVDLSRIIDRIDKSALLTHEAAEKLAIELELARELAAQDRVQITRLIVLMQRLSTSVDRLEQTSKHVASDLAASISRADQAPTEVPGAGADAALRSGQTAAEVSASKNSD